LRIEAPCDSNPCQNNGTCSNNKNDTSPYYTCGCPYGYSGQDCQIGIKILMKKSLFFHLKLKHIKKIICELKLLAILIHVKIMVHVQIIKMIPVHITPAVAHTVIQVKIVK
jgi:hypothetical protein